jgi:diaminohydroxyphosphoribosylaminopyrimidine deaminase/5-amino-6-(5-phosphoribosylamino)uracil reductase
MSFGAEDHRFMAHALQLARRGLYTTDPNPRVGCVIVKDGMVVGEGFHRRAGEPHAEPLALRAAGDAARGATVYVTLEPCCHHGRTPPCTDALLAAGVARVVSAMQDPNPRVAGQGHALLREAGVQVETGLLADESRALNPGFARRMESGLPYVRCKLAASLDGRTAMASGESQWITSDAARRDVQLLRARSSAVVTGIDTAIADDPSLNVRLPPGEVPGVDSPELLRQPVRVVLDSRLRLSPDAKMLRLPGQTWVLCSHAHPERRRVLEAEGARVVELPGREGRLDLQAVFRFLGAEQINEVLLEAGPTLGGAVLGERLIDELVIYVAPHLMGDESRGLFRLPGLQRMCERIPLAVSELRRVGTDFRITAKLAC